MFSVQDFKFVTLKIPEDDLILWETLTGYKLFCGFWHYNAAYLRAGLNLFDDFHFFMIPELDNFIRRASTWQ